MDFVPFSEDEIVRNSEGKLEIHSPITPRENYLRAARGEDPMWIPLKSDSMNFTPRVYPDNVARAFVMEAKPYTGEKGGKDIFGLPWSFVPIAGGSMITPASVSSA